MKQTSKTNETQYKTPFSILLCYIIGFLSVFVGVILIIVGVNVNNVVPAYIGGGVLGSSIILFVIHYIADDIHYLAWKAKINTIDEREYLSFILQHLQRIEENTKLGNKSSVKEPEKYTQYMDF